jgi:predicted nucleic acid-binding protein
VAERRLSYTDAVSFAIMDARRCHDALTFDQDFAVAGLRAWRENA